MKKLKDLPNIGKIMIQRLSNINIHTTDELMKLGSKEVYKRLLAYEGDTCLDTLYGLEGAIRGIRWHDLGKEDRNDLKTFFNSVNKKNY